MKKLRPAPTAAVVTLCVLLAAAVGFASRQSTQDEPKLTTHPSDAQLSIGVVSDTGSPEGRELVRGIHIWQRRLQQTLGIPFPNGVAAVKVQFADDKGSPAGARAATARLIAGGATVIFGPPAPDELEAAARVTLQKKALLLSSAPKPLTVPRATTSFFLSWPPPGSPYPIFDALDAARKARHLHRRGRVAIVNTAGAYGEQARGAENLAALRAYKVKRFRIGVTSPADAFAAARRAKPDLIYVLARPAQVYSWMARYGRKSDPPWASAVPDARELLGRSSQPLAVSVPWSPLSDLGGPIFPAHEFTRAYEDFYNETPSPTSASSAGMGVALSQGVRLARSTDTARLVKALGQIRVPSIWGILQFSDGVQHGFPAAAVLVTGKRLQPIGPTRDQWRLLQKSTPEGPPPAPPAPAPAPVTPAVPAGAGTTTTPTP